ncbi:Leucine-rich repeat protein kinase family protein [Trifolium repens]|nr:Leucine-rich repeat protein kinase family protein [Trifolium repens]
MFIFKHQNSLRIIVLQFSAIIISILLYKRWRKKHLIYEEGYTGGKMVIFRSSILKSLTTDMVLKKTQKLNNKDIIGSGGYGVVYELKLNDSAAFAVKRLNRGTAERDKGFERELQAMADIKHRNVVTLHGYYTAPHYNLLIYELMPNGSLDSLLHGRSMNKKVLDWPTRHRIAIETSSQVIYCWIRIWKLEFRISDFGLATLMEPNKTHVSTIVAGTFGYLAPEYFDTGRATVKGDVYSFGVVLLELLTGKKPSDETFMEEGTKLVTWVKTVVQEKKEELVLDSSLGPCCPMHEVNKVFNIAMMCLEPDPLNRPTMAEVVNLLDKTQTDRLATES